MLQINRAGIARCHRRSGLLSVLLFLVELRANRTVLGIDEGDVLIGAGSIRLHMQGDIGIMEVLTDLRLDMGGDIVGLVQRHVFIEHNMALNVMLRARLTGT